MTARDLLEKRINEILDGFVGQPLTTETREAIMAQMLADTSGLAKIMDGLVPSGEGGSFDDQIAFAKIFYIGTKRRPQRIAEMPNGHLHNARDKLKRERCGGLLAFTILAMDAEISRRETARAQEGKHDG